MGVDVYDIAAGRPALIVGDSLVAGEGADDGMGWAQQVAPKLNADIVGVCGATSRDILGHLPDKTYAEVVIHIGTNDARFRHGKNATETSLAEYRQNLMELVRFFRARSARVNLSFVDLLFVDEVQTVLFKPDRSYFNLSLRKVADELTAFCKTGGHTWIPLSGIDRMPANLTDGLHPTGPCHSRIAAIVAQSLCLPATATLPV